MYSAVTSSYSLSITFFVICIVLIILFRIMIMLAVGFDCKSIGVKNREMWMALAFFVPISAIVYLCIRKKLDKTVPQYCYSCGATVQPEAIVCPQCGSAELSDYVIAGSEKKRKSALICLIIGLVAYAAGCIFSFLGLISLVQPLLQDYYDNGSSYYDFDENYGGYDDFFEYDDNYEEYFDDYSGDFYQMP